MVMSDPTAAAGAGAAPRFVVDISDEQQAVSLDHDLLRRIVCAVLQEEAIAAAQISVALVDDPAIHEVNRTFLQHDYPTDVISFLLEEGPAPLAVGADPPAERGRRIEGEVVISGETAARTAGELGCPAEDETILYLVHGLLHLCGYDDGTDADRARMRRREQWHLQKSGITANYDC